MRCVLCARPLIHPAVFIADHAVGPVCARRAGLLVLAARGNNKALKLGPAGRVVRKREDDTQMPLELEVA